MWRRHDVSRRASGMLITISSAQGGIGRGQQHQELEEREASRGERRDGPIGRRKCAGVELGGGRRWSTTRAWLESEREREEGTGSTASSPGAWRAWRRGVGRTVAAVRSSATLGLGFSRGEESRGERRGEEGRFGGPPWPPGEQVARWQEGAAAVMAPVASLAPQWRRREEERLTGGPSCQVFKHFLFFFCFLKNSRVLGILLSHLNTFRNFGKIHVGSPPHVETTQKLVLLNKKFCTTFVHRVWI